MYCIMASAADVPVPGAAVVIVCSGSHHHQQQQVQGQAAARRSDGVDESPPQLQRRRSANYQPTTWDYDSICSEPEPEPEPEPESETVHAALKESVRRMLLELDDDSHTNNTSSRKNSSRLVRTINQLQSLGIAYHFEQEIRAILMSMHDQHAHHGLDLDLSSAALLFRMLRARGIPASTDMLLMRDQDAAADGKVTVDDSDGLLDALYQASYLAFPGETVLDQVRAFAVDNLLLAGRRRDDLPSHWTAPRLQAMWSLRLDQAERRRGNYKDVDPAILQLAQVDFNLVQALHRRELAEVTRWWKETRLGEKLPFARDRVVECFFCAACIAPEPRLAASREALAKAGSLIVHLDDIYDVYGTLDELRAFTDAVASWDDVPPPALPGYMKAMYSAIWETSVAAAERVLERHGHDVLPLYRKAWRELCEAFMVEAQWQHQGYRPCFAEYVGNGWVTSTGPLLLLHALLPAAAPVAKGGNGAASNSIARLVELSSTIFRLCNDCASHEAESERGDAPSSIACCMAEAWCAGEEQARATVQGVIAETWKALNREVAVFVSGGNPSCSSGAESMTIMANLCLNLARIIHCIYQDGDGITSPTHRMKHMVKDLLFNPIPIHHVL